MKLENARAVCPTARPRWAAVVFVTLGFSLRSFAGLGGYADSVEVDRAKMKASTTIKQTTGYTVHEITTPMKTVVREYVGPDGHVFGVAWQGPFLPDLSQIFGSYFQQYTEAMKAEHRGYSGRRPVDLRQPNLVVQGGGHMLGHFGRAYVPTLLPEGVSSDAIR